MGASSIIVRPLASPAEHQLHFQFADQAFSPDSSPWDPQRKNLYSLRLKLRTLPCNSTGGSSKWSPHTVRRKSCYSTDVLAPPTM